MNLSIQRAGSAISAHGRGSLVHVIVGRDYAHHKELSLLVRHFSEGLIATQVIDLADEFAWADLCICGGGLTKYESAYMGVPAAVLYRRTFSKRKRQFNFPEKDWQ